MNTNTKTTSPFAGNVINQFFIDRRNIMRIKFFSNWLRLAAAVLLLLTAFAASPAQADAPIAEGILSVGYLHNCALKPDGSVDCWGYDGDGQSADQPGPYTQVSAGYYHTCALTPSGAVDCWGSNLYGQADDQPGPYTQVSAGLFYTCALTVIRHIYRDIS